MVLEGFCDWVVVVCWGYGGLYVRGCYFGDIDMLVYLGMEYCYWGYSVVGCERSFGFDGLVEVFLVGGWGG